jgi:transcriptional regulator with XRE-family HTH domain
MADTNDNTAESLKAFLKVRGWKAVNLARELGVSQAQVSRWLSGENQPQKKMQAALKEKFGLSLTLAPIDAIPPMTRVKKPSTEEALLDLIESLGYQRPRLKKKK